LASGSSSLRKWAWVHKWSSIVCTIFMLLLCITGLPLIFHEEIDDLLHEQVKAGQVPEGTPLVDLDRAVASGLAAAPKQVAHFLIWDPDDANSLLLSAGPSIDVNPTDNRIIRVDAHTGTFLDAPDVTGRFTYIMLKLHTDMFAGLPGKLFLGLMGILFCAAIVSGIVVYAPSMLIPGMLPDWVAAIAPLATVFGGETVNPLTAPPGVIAALPGVERDQVAAFLKARRSFPADVDRLVRLVGPAQRYLAVKPPRVASVEFVAELANGYAVAARSVIAVLPQDSQPYRVLVWTPVPSPRLL
jgi:hypothetical protein